MQLSQIGSWGSNPWHIVQRELYLLELRGKLQIWPWGIILWNSFCKQIMFYLRGAQPTSGLGIVSPNLRCLQCTHLRLSWPTGSTSVKWRGRKTFVIQPIHLFYVSAPGFLELSLPVWTLKEGGWLKDKHMKSDKPHWRSQWQCLFFRSTEAQKVSINVFSIISLLSHTKIF